MIAVRRTSHRLEHDPSRVIDVSIDIVSSIWSAVYSPAGSSLLISS